MGRAPALLALVAALVAWYEVAPHLGTVSLWRDVAIISLAVIPVLFGISLLLVPAWDSRLVPGVALLAILLAVGLWLLDLQVPANFAKFAAVTAVAWLFLRYFEALSWVVLVACIIPWVDAYSVWRGPTHSITTHHEAVFTRLSVAFVVPGHDVPARIGLPDVLFFSVFLAASVRFRLRPRATWLCMVASLGITISLTTFWSSGGLPALPGISLGFLLPNIDLIWTRLRGTAPAGSDRGVALE